jgi:hypothetical protein
MLIKSRWLIAAVMHRPLASLSPRLLEKVRSRSVRPVDAAVPRAGSGAAAALSFALCAAENAAVTTIHYLSHCLLPTTWLGYCRPSHELLCKMKWFSNYGRSRSRAAINVRGAWLRRRRLVISPARRLRNIFLLVFVIFRRDGFALSVCWWSANSAFCVCSAYTWKM